MPLDFTGDFLFVHLETTPILNFTPDTDSGVEVGCIGVNSGVEVGCIGVNSGVEPLSTAPILTFTPDTDSGGGGGSGEEEEEEGKEKEEETDFPRAGGGGPVPKLSAASENPDPIATPCMRAFSLVQWVDSHYLSGWVEYLEYEDIHVGYSHYLSGRGVPESS